MSNDREHSIRQRAYALWEKEGGGHGRHEDHWHQASREHDGDGTDAGGETGGGAAEQAPAGEVSAIDTVGTPADQTPVDGPVAPPVRKPATRQPKAPADQTPLDGPVAPPVEAKPAKARKPKITAKTGK